jgi:hypothetical protein
MYFLPLRDEMRLMFGHLRHQASHVRSFDTDAENRLGHTVWASDIDLRLPRARDVNMSRFMIEGVDHESESMSAMHNDHCFI